jgi:hypothetical protein
MEFVEVQGKMKPKNGQNFPLLDGQDITPGSIAETQLTPGLRDKVNSGGGGGGSGGSIIGAGFMDIIPYKSGAIISNMDKRFLPAAGSNFSNSFASNSIMTFVPFFVNKALTINQVGLRGSGTGLVKFVIYDTTEDGSPKDALINTPPFGVIIGHSFFVLSSNFTFNPNKLYWIALISPDFLGVQLQGLAARYSYPAFMMRLDSGNNNPVTHIRYAISYSDTPPSNPFILDANAPSAGSVIYQSFGSAESVPLFFFKVA